MYEHEITVLAVHAASANCCNQTLFGGATRVVVNGNQTHATPYSVVSCSLTALSFVVE